MRNLVFTIDIIKCNSLLDYERSEEAIGIFSTLII